MDTGFALLLTRKRENTFEMRKESWYRMQMADTFGSGEIISVIRMIFGKKILKASRLPGVTSAPRLQPIETRLVMLQTGMRAPMGIKVKGDDLREIEAFGLELEKHLIKVEGVKKAAVFAERIVGKPYLLLKIRREAIAQIWTHGPDRSDLYSGGCGGNEHEYNCRRSGAVRDSHPLSTGIAG